MSKESQAVAQTKEGGGKLHNTMVYIRQHWQLYVLFLLPAFVLTIIFRYLPMGGVLIAFEEYNPIAGILGSEWVGLEHFERFLSSPDFMRYLMNTLKLSFYGLIWGFPAPILLAFLLNRILSAKTKQKMWP
jgi:putative aldouronate transport system permease protein